MWQVLQGHSGDLNSVAFSPNSEQLVTSSDDHTARLWDVLQGECIEVLTGHSAVVNSALFSWDGGESIQVRNAAFQLLFAAFCSFLSLKWLPNG